MSFVKTLVRSTDTLVDYYITYVVFSVSFALLTEWLIVNQAVSVCRGAPGRQNILRKPFGRVLDSRFLFY
jgi:hypothetical protein